MAKKITRKANRFLHAVNPRSVISPSDVRGSSSIIKETRYVEGGWNGMPYIKAGIKQEKFTEHKNKMLVRKDGSVYRIVGK
ncbi:MAG: hypothetical protein K5777_05005 [Nitrosopumilus sp.]|nr:hypothetical protein [Nitrosopumilus sp.]